MKKSVIVIVTLWSVISQISGIKLSDTSIKKDYRQWELVRTIPEDAYIGDTLEYQLIMQIDPHKLMLKDVEGHVWWTKTNLSAGTWFDVDNVTIVSDSYFPDELIYDTMGLGTNKLLDRKGNCLLRDKSNNRFVFVDKKGNEVYLPTNITNWNYCGLYYDKYLVFWDTQKQCVIFDKKGSQVKQFKLPDGGVWESMIYFDKNLNYLTYELSNSEGYVLMKTTGEVIKAENHRSSLVEVYYPVFSDDSSLWIPTADGTHDFEILDTNTGERVFRLDDPYVSVCQASNSNKAAGYLIYTSKVSEAFHVQVLDYKNLNMLFNQESEKAEYRNPWISGDGKEIRFTYQEEDKPVEVRFYRMK
jgi:hypothetical protein